MMNNEPLATNNPSETPLYLLCVDDEAEILKALTRVFRRESFKVLTAASGPEALAIMERTENIGLILSDQRMPDMNGSTFLQLAKKMAPEIPRMILTGYSEIADAIEVINQGGAQKFLEKPWDDLELLRIVRENFDQYRLLKENQRLKAAIAAVVEKNLEKDLALMRSEKMAAIGQLAAGVAHEINTPMGYISCNLTVLATYQEQIVRFIHDRRISGGHAPTATPAETVAADRESQAMESILEDLPELIKETLEGAERITKIVKDLKNFSRVDKLEHEAVTLTSCLESALTICFNTLKKVARIRKEYEAGPKVLCHPGQLNQVFLNLLLNAGQSMVEPGEVVLKVRHDDHFVYASVSDTGGGIPGEIMSRIFDPFFTTKEVGKGTGLGLSISSEIINKHNGELLVESVVGVGTTFTVKLPRTPVETHPQESS